MGSWRRNIYALSVVALLTCACAISSKRSAEARLLEGVQQDLQEHGFLIATQSDTGGPTVAVTDAEATDRLIQWFRHRPKPSNGGAQAFAGALENVEQDMIEASCNIDTTHIRARIKLLTVSLETRPSPADPWTKVSWTLREEDAELREWISLRINAELERIAPFMREQGMLADDSELDWAKINDLIRDTRDEQSRIALPHTPTSNATDRTDKY